MIENFSSDFPKILRRVVQEGSSAGDLRTSLDLMVDQIKRAMHTEVCSVHLKHQDSQKYILMATRGLNPEAARVVTLNKHEGLVGFVGDRAEPLNLNDAQSHPRNRFIAGLGEPFHSFLGDRQIKEIPAEITNHPSSKRPWGFSGTAIKQDVLMKAKSLF